MSRAPENRAWSRDLGRETRFFCKEGFGWKIFAVPNLDMTVATTATPPATAATPTTTATPAFAISPPL